MSEAKVGTSIEDAIKNSDWSSVSIALWPHIVEQMKLHSKNIFECEMVYDLAHINTVPALYDDNNGTRKQVIVPMKVFAKDLDAELVEAKKATTAANTAASNADKAREGLETKKQQVDDAIGASKTATEAAKQATTDTLASKKAIEQNEETRKTAEHLRETNTSTAIESSKTQTDLAKELNEHPTKMGDNGNWWMWNLQTHAYEDTGIIARGGAMYPTFRQSRNKLLMIDYGSNVSEHVVKRRNKLVIKV